MKNYGEGLKDIMNHKLCAIIATLLFAMPIRAQQTAVDSLYFEAYTEIADMLDGKQPLSILKENINNTIARVKKDWHIVLLIWGI